VPAFKPVYLIHGDDHGRIAERRAKLRALAEAEHGAGDVEIFEGETCTPEAIAAALSAMTFAMGRRFIVADGVEKWKEADVAPVAAAIAGMDPDATTVAFFAREEGRAKAPAALHKAVTAAGGTVAAEHAPKANELPGWVVEQGRALGLRLDVLAARALVARVGDRRQRLTRELEKLALELGSGATVTQETVEEATASSSERKFWTLTDALVAGDRVSAVRTLGELLEQGDRVPGLIYRMVTALRDAHGVAVALAAGQSPAQIKSGLRMPPFKADRMISAVRKRDVETYRGALELLADLECDSRGGVGLGATLSAETAAFRTVTAITS